MINCDKLPITISSFGKMETRPTFVLRLRNCCSSMNLPSSWWVPHTSGEYNAKVGRAFLKRMTPENAIITITNSDFKIDKDWKTEPWYKAQYRDVKMTPQQIENSGPIHPRLIPNYMFQHSMSIFQPTLLSSVEQWKPSPMTTTFRWNYNHPNSFWTFTIIYECGTRWISIGRFQRRIFVSRF